MQAFFKSGEFCGNLLLPLAQKVTQKTKPGRIRQAALSAPLLEGVPPPCWRGFLL